MMNNKGKTILLSPVGGQAISGIVKYFKDSGARIVGIDKDPEAIGRHFIDKFIPVPDVSDKAYAGTVFNVIRDNKVDIFISWLDPEIIFWNERFYASEIPGDLIDVFALNFRKDIINFYDKFVFYSSLKNKGFNCPKTFLLDDDRAMKTYLPAVIKPRIGYGTKDTYIVENEDSFRYFRNLLLNKFGNIQKFIIQEFLEGAEFTIDFFSVNGKVVNAVARKRVKHKGVSLIGEVIHDDGIGEFVRHFCSTFDITGLNNIQIIKSGGNHYILDFNPRPSGTIVFSINAGVDLMNNLLEKKEGKKITEYGKPRKLKMVRHLCEHFYE